MGKEADVEQFDSSWSRFIEQQYLWYQPKQDAYLWCRVTDFELMLMRCHGEFGFKNKNWSRLERFRFLKKLHIPLHFRRSSNSKKELYLQYYQVLLAIGLIIMMRRNGEWIQQQITQQTHFAKIALHRKTDWKIAKKLLNTDATAVRGVKLIEIIAAIKIQAMTRGYLERKRLRRRLSM